MVAAKLVAPSAVRPVVCRAGLDAKLTCAVERPVTLVCASAGSGKTLAVAGWVARSADHRVAWLTIDGTDNDPAVLMTDVQAALAVCGALDHDGTVRHVRSLAGELRRLQACLEGMSGGVTIVLDDLQEVTNPEALVCLSRLIEQMTPALRWVLVSRVEPAVRLHRLRVAGQLSEIGPADLAFDPSDVDGLFARHGMRLTAGQARTLIDRTEGWAAGLQLAASCLDPGDVDTGIAAFAGHLGPVTGYLVDEVWNRQPPPARNLLLRTSVVERVSGVLADALTGRGDGWATLERLAAEHAFVFKVDREPDWFRFHPLLREMLLHRLSVEDPARVSELHGKAANWHLGAGSPVDALRHAVLAGDAGLLSKVVLDAALPRLGSSEGVGLVAAMRPAVGANIDHPTITGSVCAAAVHLYQGDYAAAAGEVYAARRLLLADSDDTTTEAVLALFEATLSRARGDFPTAGKRARHVLDRLDHHEQTAPAAALRYRAMALCEVGTAHVWNGRSGDAADFLRAGSAQAERLGLDLSHASALAHLALVDVIDGDLNQAEKRVVMAAEMIDQPGASAPRLVEGQLALALIHLCRGEWADADWRLARGLAVGERNVDRATWLALRVAQARIQLGRGQVISSRRAVAWVRDQIDGGGVRSLLLDRWISLADADVLLAAGQPARAIDRLEQRPGLCSQERVRLARAMLALGRVANAEATVDSVLDGPALADVGTAVEAWLVRALVAEHRRCDNAAAEACAQALELAEPQGFRLPFLVLGGAVARQLHREMQLIGDHPEFIADILARLGAGTGHADPPIEPLTDRQMAILRWLPSMRGNQEIADELFVTVNTVKAHLKALYRKLGVTSRREAVARAKERGLI